MRRERKLVTGNPSLLNIWNNILQRRTGQKVEIIAEYIWEPNRVEAIRFSTPAALVSPPPKKQPPLIPRACDRSGSQTDTLLPWEKRLLSLAIGLGEDALSQVKLHFVLPQNKAETGGIIEFHAVRIALGKGFAITIYDDIWFPRTINTSKIDDLLWLVHEAAHVRQYREWGKEGFLKAYISEFLAKNSYADILAERKASLTADSMKDFLNNHPELTKLIQACSDISDRLANNAHAFLDEFQRILVLRAKSGAYGDDVRADAERFERLRQRQR
ncbi:MAG: hypothetical protein MOB07_31305 [Acidobacteria bacterium]|nr:hypothetical protein [Acidobacteriota bacterium]